MLLLLVRPEDGAAPLVEAMNDAKESIDLSVFRLSHPVVESAPRAAVADRQGASAGRPRQRVRQGLDEEAGGCIAADPPPEQRRQRERRREP
jgi:hypothetical protein